MIGGELIATGSSSCVLTPNIPCKKNGTVKKDRISKIIYSEDAIYESIGEKRMNEKIKKIKGYSSWAVIFDEYCKPMKKEILSEYDEEGLSDCLDNEEPYLVEDFDENSYMMNGIYGGITLDGYFEQVFNKKIKKSKAFNNEFYDLMRRMEPLFSGLKKMNENNIIHNDIKPNNIVLHKGVFKYIDFGLSAMKSNKQHFKQRSLDELKTNRIYTFYPIEYLLYYASQDKLNEELRNIYNGQHRRNYEHLNQVNMLFGSYGTDVYESVSSDLRKKKIKETKMIQSIDVYSLGILVPLLFLFHTQLWNTKNPSETLKQVIDGNELVKDFFHLFGQMVNPSSNQRITSNDASIQFKRLLKKYHPKRKNKSKVKKNNSKKGRKLSRKVSRKTKKRSMKRSMKRRKNSTPRIIERVNMRREAY